MLHLNSLCIANWKDASAFRVYARQHTGQDDDSHARGTHTQPYYRYRIVLSVSRIIECKRDNGKWFSFWFWFVVVVGYVFVSVFWALKHMCKYFTFNTQQPIHIMDLRHQMFMRFQFEKLTPIAHSAHSYFLVLCTAHSISCRNLNQNPIISHHKIDNTFFYSSSVISSFQHCKRINPFYWLRYWFAKQPRWKSIPMVIMFYFKYLFWIKSIYF